MCAVVDFKSSENTINTSGKKTGKKNDLLYLREHDDFFIQFEPQTGNYIPFMYVCTKNIILSKINSAADVM